MLNFAPTSLQLRIAFFDLGKREGIALLRMRNFASPRSNSGQARRHALHRTDRP